MVEILIVDNHSEVPAAEAIEVSDPRIRIIRTDRNRGAVARNDAFAVATGDVVIALDDDVFGLDEKGLDAIAAAMAQPDVAAVNFRIADRQTGAPMNWCHHYDAQSFWMSRFATNEISEGAVALRRHSLDEVGFYPESFFISHEGPDLAFRLMNHGYQVVYDPDVLVYHEPAQEARVSWRRYYYDTRNLFWLAARNYPFWYGLKKVTVQAGALFVYAVRDGFLLAWLRGVAHGIGGLRTALATREAPKPGTVQRVREIESNRPPFWKLVRARLFRKGVQI